MNTLYKTRSNCRLCNSMDLEKVIPLGGSPVSEKYRKYEELKGEQIKVPLDLYFCGACSHVQILDIVDPQYLWSDLTFKTSNNPHLIKHFDDVASRIIKINNIQNNDLIIDVGSNDGTLLNSFRDLGYTNILGIDPAEDIVKEAIKKGIPTKAAFMNCNLAQDIVNEFGKASIVTANNVYAHVDDMAGLTNAISDVMKEDGIFVFEVSYLLDVIQNNLIGTIFHEHLSYHSVKPLNNFLRSHNLELFHIERGPEQGGSIVCYTQKLRGKHKIRASVKELINLEEQYQLHIPETIKSMFNRLQAVKVELISFISKIKLQGKTISGFGAARAGTTLLSFYEIGHYLDYLFDDNETKHGKYSPGDNIKVLPTSQIYNKKPDYLLILAWLHADKIITSHQKYIINNNNKFIRIFPEFKIVSN